MELRPKYSLDSFKVANLSAMREFTDREEPTKAFMNAFNQKVETSYKVLTYYGIGGIGKSRLLKELYRKVDFQHSSVVKGLLNFKEEKHRNPGDALICLREDLKKSQNIKFTTFDLAYAVYWKKLNPQLSLKSNDTTLPFIEEGSFIGEIIDQLENVPLALWIPRTLKLLNGMTKYKEMLQWWTGRGKEVMAQLQDMVPNEIEEMLSVYWAADVRDYINTHKSSAVIFIDTYEALWENKRQQGSFHEKDAWVQELVLQLPEVLWVICGREKIQWGKTNAAWNNEEYLEQHLMGELSNTDSDKFLQSCGISAKNIRTVIIEASHGLPYYLDLMVDTYNLITEKRIPQPHDFSKAPQQISDRFFKYLELPEKETLKILSFTRFWTVELFQRLVTEFKTGYPLTAYMELFRFSFINKEKSEEWNMHAMMRTSLQEEVSSSDRALYQQIHSYLFMYFEQKLQMKDRENSKEETKRFFQEAFYHGKLSLQTNDFLTWFLEKSEILKSRGEFQLLSSYNNELNSYLSQENEQVLHASIYQFYGEINLLQGKYEQSVQEYENALSVYRIVTVSNPILFKQMGRCNMDLAEIMIHINDYEKAFAYLQEGTKHFESYLGKEDDDFYSTIALLFIRLGKLNIRFSNYNESMENYKRAIYECEKAVKNSKGSSTLLAMNALAYEKLGELYGSSHYDLQGECYLKSIEYYEKALKDPDVQNYTRILTNMGLTYKRLAEHYSATINLSNKIRSFNQAIAIYDQVLEHSPYFIDAHEKKGHALVDYMVLQIELNLLDEAMESFQSAVDTFKIVIDLSPKQGGSRNRLASAYRELSKLYLKKNQKDKALAVLHDSLNLSNNVLKETPNYIYIHNSLGKTFEIMADIYLETGYIENADKNYQLAIEHFDKMLQKSPKLREPLQRKERINLKHSDLVNTILTVQKEK